jgi:WD40 repeat protein
VLRTDAAHRTFSLSGTPIPEHHQVGNVWTQPHEVVSLSASGDYNLFDTRSNEAPRVLTGHQKGITALARHVPSSTLFSGSYDGRIISYDAQGERTPVRGPGHSNGVVALASAANRIASVGMDDSLRFIETQDVTYRCATIQCSDHGTC